MAIALWHKPPQTQHKYHENATKKKKEEKLRPHQYTLTHKAIGGKEIGKAMRIKEKVNC